jgi:hypothetical protein
MTDLQYWMSIAASAISIIGGPISLYFSWKAARNAGHAVSGANELARRMTREALYVQDQAGNVTGTRVQIVPPKK